MIAIIDYGVGNLRSVQKAFESIGGDAKICSSPKEIESAERVVLPGVGAIKPAMEKLEAHDFIGPIQAAIDAGKPFLGICVGYQLLFEESSEGGNVKGLGFIKGKVGRFSSLKVPHMGWNQISIQSESPLFKNITDGTYTYFCHSYYAQTDQKEAVAATTDYGITFASAVSFNNIYGVQFHPEKSQSVGLQILKNFTEISS